MQTRHPPPWLPTAGLLLAMLLWASSFVALKLAFSVYDPMVVIFGRMAIASICFLFFAGWFMRTVTFRLRDAKTILFMALCEPCLYFLFEAKALQNTTASQAGMITAMLPILVAIAAWSVLKERVGVNTWLGAGLAVAGVCWLSLESFPTEGAPNPILGNFFEFMAMVCAAGYMISLKGLIRHYSPFFLTALQAFIGSLFYFPFLLFPGTQLPTAFDPISGGAVVYLGAVVTLGAYGLYNYGLKYTPASQAAAFINLIPVFSVLMGWLLLGESFTLKQCLAAVLIMIGVTISQQRRRTMCEGACPASNEP